MSEFNMSDHQIKRSIFKSEYYKEQIADLRCPDIAVVKEKSLNKIDEIVRKYQDKINLLIMLDNDMKVNSPLIEYGSNIIYESLEKTINDLEIIKDLIENLTNGTEENLTNKRSRILLKLIQDGKTHKSTINEKLVNKNNQLNLYRYDQRMEKEDPESRAQNMLTLAREIFKLNQELDNLESDIRTITTLKESGVGSNFYG